MGKTKISAPPAPDPAALVAAQGESNFDTARLNQIINQVGTRGPGGTTSFNQVGGSYINGKFVPSFEQVSTLSPQAQRQFDAQAQTSADLSQLAQQSIGQVAAAQANPFTTTGLPEQVTGIQGPGQQSLDTRGIAPIQQGGIFGGPIQNRVDTGFVPGDEAGLAAANAAAAQGPTGFGGGQIPAGQFGQFGGQAPQGFNFSNQSTNFPGPPQQQAQPFQSSQAGQTFNEQIQTQPVVGDPSAFVPADTQAQADRVERSTFDRFQNLANPLFTQQREQQGIRLGERGLPTSSRASLAATGALQGQQNRAIQDAAFQSIEAGRGERSRLQAEGLARGQFANQAAGQAFGQNLAGREAGFGQSLAERGFGREGSNLGFNQALQLGQFGREGQAQQFGQGLAAGSFANQAQQQQFGQGLASRELAANASNQALAQALSRGQFGNAAQNTAFNQQLTNAQLQNAARQQGFQERAFIQDRPINNIAALLGTAGSVNQPQFQGIVPTQVAGTDVIGANLGSAQIGQDRARAAQEQQSGIFGGLSSLAGAALPFVLSDIRAKNDITKVGKINGHNLYEYSYKGSTERVLGVMAQEIEMVLPDAVKEIDGLKHVNYDMIKETV